MIDTIAALVETQVTTTLPTFFPMPWTPWVHDCLMARAERSVRLSDMIPSAWVRLPIRRAAAGAVTGRVHAGQRDRGTGDAGHTRRAPGVPCRGRRRERRRRTVRPPEQTRVRGPRS